MLDKKIIKEKLEAERDMLLSELQDMGKLNTDTGEWEAIPEEQDFPEADPNDMADRFEDFETKSSNIEALEPRLSAVLLALKNIDKESFGKCIVCKNDIQPARMEANPAANTCTEHME